MATEGTKAVFLDGMGTLLRLVPPGPALSEEAFRAEVAYYVEHHLEGRDPAGLADLRRRCAEVAGVPVETLIAALRFEAFPDAAPALTALRERGLRLVVVSNWDCSLPAVLDEVGLGQLVDHVVTSAAVGAAKPDPRIFEAALTASGCAPGEALHVGDSPTADVDGAHAAGIRAVLLDRAAGGGDGERVTSLAQIDSLLS
jgi:HAD superfamily hydrolase (TIGR01509 family)